MAQLLIQDVVILISSFSSAITFPDFLHFVSAYIGDLRINLRAHTLKNFHFLTTTVCLK